MIRSGRVISSWAETDRIAYANETNVVNKDSQIYSLTLINQKTTTLSTSRTQAGTIYSVILKPRVQSIDFEQNFTGMKKTVDQCQVNRVKKHVSRVKTGENAF